MSVLGEDDVEAVSDGGESDDAQCDEKDDGEECEGDDDEDDEGDDEEDALDDEGEVVHFVSVS